MVIIRNIYMISLLLPAFTACSRTEVNPEPQPYALVVPGNFPAAAVMMDNPLTKQGVELGRMLFYDPRLSGNNRISCASCHHPEKAFSDGLALSAAGVSGNRLHRHAPALINMAWANNGLFWDGGSTNLESQAFGPLAHPDEMFQNLQELTDELNALPAYRDLFRLVFREEINPSFVVRALAQFQRTLISGNSRYDKFIRREPGGNMSNIELRGLELFGRNCSSCHTGALFTDNDYHNNGLDADFSNDAAEGIYQGRFRVTYNPDDLGKFRTPTVRNILLTAPYMHDGRMATIEEVLQHYSQGVKVSATTAAGLVRNGTGGLQLSQEEQQAIIAFLGTLTDSTFIHNNALGKPVLP